MRAGPEDDTAVPVDAESARALGPDPFPLSVLEGTTPLLATDRGEVATPLAELALADERARGRVLERPGRLVGHGGASPSRTTWGSSTSRTGSVKVPAAWSRSGA